MIYFKTSTPSKIVYIGSVDSVSSIQEQNRHINELDEEDRNTILKIVDKMLTTKKFNQFFKENIKA